jgi:dTDP-4-dehydrorhamnose 3,5-epimerase-like enzyme
MTTLENVKLISLKTFIEPDGNLVPIESDSDIPFPIERIFYVFGVHNQNDRGKHSHFKTKQVLICLNGEVSVLCKDGNKERTWVLNKPNQALYIPELIWDEQVYTKPDSVLLVLANTNYDESDYITDYNKFKRLKNESK